MKKAFGMLVLAITSVVALAPAAVAADRDDWNYAPRQVEYRTDDRVNEHQRDYRVRDRRDIPVRKQVSYDHNRR
jgi:hypothetical protein